MAEHGVRLEENAEPEARLEENAEPVHYNIQEQTSYAGRFLVNIRFPRGQEESVFKSDFMSERTVEIPLTVEGDDISLKNAVIKALTSSFYDKNLFPNLDRLSGILRFVEKPSDSRSILEAYSILPISRKLARLDVDELVSMMQAGKSLCIYRSMYGDLTYRYIRFGDLDKGRFSTPYGPSGYETYEHYICINSINGRHPNGLNISCTSGFCITVRGNARPKHRDKSYTDTVKPYRRHSFPPFIYQVQKVSISFKTVPESSCIEGIAKQDTPGRWDNWTFEHQVFADDPSRAGQKSFVIIATAHYDEDLDPEETSIGIVVSFTGPPGSPDDIHPSVRINSPAKWAQHTGDWHGLTLSIGGTASDHPRGTGIKSVEVTIDDDIGLYTEATPRHHSWSTWTASKTIFSSGIHTITARCTDNAGNVEQDRIPITVTITPKLIDTNLFLVERYRLSSFLGNYRIGKIINKISLLPREKTKISIRTFANSEKERELSSCILDSLTEYSSDDFEASLARENTDNQIYDESYKYCMATESEPGWGFGSCNLTSALTAGTISARHEFAKNVNNAIRNHVSMASARRDIQVSAECEIKAKSEEEEKLSTRCEIRNINHSRTLNLTFRQLTQEFISILHLVDVRVAILRREYIEDSRCLRIKYHEVSLPQLDAFLDEVLVKDERELKQQVTEFILLQLCSILNYNDVQRQFIEDKSFKNAMGEDIPGSNYLRVKNLLYTNEDLCKEDLNDTYADPDDPRVNIKLPGIIMSVSKNVLRTEGVLVEPLLGHIDTLDDYSKESLEKIELRE